MGTYKDKTAVSGLKHQWGWKQRCLYL